MKEILAGDGIRNAFCAIGIDAICTYEGDHYEVWKLSEIEFNKLNSIHDVDWDDFYWGWWRSAEGSIIEDNPHDFPVQEFTIKGEKMLGYIDASRYQDYLDDCLEDCEEEEYEEDKSKLDAWYYTHDSLTDYLLSEFGVSTERNVCAITVALARLNKMTLGELFTKYGG